MNHQIFDEEVFASAHTAADVQFGSAYVFHLFHGAHSYSLILRPLDVAEGDADRTPISTLPPRPCHRRLDHRRERLGAGVRQWHIGGAHRFGQAGGLRVGLG